jgi:hypothetical protein
VTRELAPNETDLDASRILLGILIFIFAYVDWSWQVAITDDGVELNTFFKPIKFSWDEISEFGRFKHWGSAPWWIYYVKSTRFSVHSYLNEIYT